MKKMISRRKKVNIISEYNLPEKLHELYNFQDKNSEYFRHNAWLYNNGIGMSSVTAKKGLK